MQCYVKRKVSEATKPSIPISYKTLQKYVALESRLTLSFYFLQ